MRKMRFQKECAALIVTKSAQFRIEHIPFAYVRYRKLMGTRNVIRRHIERRYRIDLRSRRKHEEFCLLCTRHPMYTLFHGNKSSVKDLRCISARSCGTDC